MDKEEEEEEGGEEVKEKKMTRQELKKLKKKVRDEQVCVWEGYRLIHPLQEEMERRARLEEENGSQFSVSQRETKMVNALLETTKDIKIEKFSISARGKDLLVNASLQITAGRRYGLVGPNG